MGVKSTKTKKRRKVNTSRLMIVLSLILLLVIGSYAFINSSIFNVKNIKIEGNAEIEDKTIIEALEINNDKNIFMHSKKQMEEKLKENPYIEEVKVEKKLPNSLIIDIKEREIAAVIKNDDTYSYIDKNGKLLEKLPKLKSKNSGIIVNIPYSINENKEVKFQNEQSKKRLLYLLECIQDNNLSKKITTVDLNDEDTINMLTKEKIKVVLYNDEKISYNISRISAILAELQNDNLKGGTIDLTYSNYAVYRP